MTTRQRLDLIARAYPRAFPRAEMIRLLRRELGDLEALDHGRVRAPKMIYHICAGNLAVSAQASLVHGLLLGAHNILKLPSTREDSIVRSEILAFVRGLPASLRKLVERHDTLQTDVMRRADAVVAFGSDDTMERVRSQLRFDQKFIAHGHALSLLFIGDNFTAKQVRACAVDILTYDQLGCLSPQAVYVGPEFDVLALGAKLALVLEDYWKNLNRKPARPLSIAAKIGEARDMAFALGNRVWLPPQRHLGWTLVYNKEAKFQPSPLHGVITIHRASAGNLRKSLATVAGRISTVGIAGEMNSRWKRAFLSLGVSRFCAAGRMQFPPLTWHHDGRSTLADLVTWIDDETAG